MGANWRDSQIRYLVHFDDGRSGMRYRSEPLTVRVERETRLAAVPLPTACTPPRTHAHARGLPTPSITPRVRGLDVRGGGCRVVQRKRGSRPPTLPGQHCDDRRCCSRRALGSAVM
jgi:hypothetical protein